MLTSSLRVALWATAILVPLSFAATHDANAATRTAKGSLPLQIQGRAFTPAGPLVNAAVTGFAGALPVETTTDTNGDFTLTLGFADVASLARLSLRGTGAQSHVEFVSVPGPYTMLAVMAGDGTLDRSEDPYVDLTPHTTGVYLAMSSVVPLTNETNWSRARRGFVPQDALFRTAILGALAESLVPLPAGTATTLEAASQIPTAQATVDLLYNTLGECRPVFCALEAQLLAPPAVPALETPLQNAEIRNYQTFRGVLGFPLTAVQLDAGGTGTISMERQRLAIVWGPNGNVIRIRQPDDAPILTVNSTTTPTCSGSTPVATVTEITAYRVRYLRDPAGGIMLQHGSELRINYPGTPACTQVITNIDPAFYFRTVAQGEVPIVFPDPTGKTVILPVCETACADPPTSDVSLTNRATEPHSFSAGGVGTQVRIGRAFTWSLEAGRLNITYANGHSAEFTQVSDELPAIGTVVARYVDSTAVPYILSGLVVAKDPLASFGTDAVSAAGAYDSKINQEYPFVSIQPYDASRELFGFTFLPDGTGTRLNGTGFVRWYLENGGNRIRHERFANSTSIPLLQRRLWEVIRVDGDEFLVLENSNLSPPTPLNYPATPRLFAYVRANVVEPGSAPETPVTLEAPGNAGDGTGTAVALGGDFIVIGAPDAAVSGIDAGAVYVFRKPNDAAAASVGKDGLARFSTKGLELVATLSSPTPTIGDKWGTSVTISPGGEKIAIGAPGTGSGEVAVFERPVGDWVSDSSPNVTLTAPTVVGATVEGFGASVSMTDSGSLAVGAPGTDIGNKGDAGFAAVYVPSGATYGTPQQILPIDEQEGGGFGSVVAASDSLLAIGAPRLDGEDGTRDAGAVFAYTTGTPGTSYNLSATLTAPTTSSIGDKFGTSVAVSGGTLLVGAPGTDTSHGTDTGSGYIYESAGLAVPTTPSTQLLPQGIEGDGSGTTVALIEGVALLGAPLATRDGEPASGTTFYFRRPTTTWSQTAELTSEFELLPTRPQANQFYGGALALSQDLILAAAPNRDLDSEEGQGEVEAIVLDRIFRGTFE